MAALQRGNKKMADIKETKRIEQLIALTREKLKLLREEATLGNYEAEYAGEKDEEQKYSRRLTELREHNAREEAAANQPAPPKYAVS